MGYQDHFDGQRPPWDESDYSGYAGYTGPQPAAFQHPAEEFRRGDFQGGDFQGGDFQRGDFQREDFQRGDFQRGRQGDEVWGGRREPETVVDGLRAVGRTTIDGRQYGVTTDGWSATRTGPQARSAQAQPDAERYDMGQLEAELDDADSPGRGRRGRGLLAGGTAGFLSAALALGAANLAAAFVRPQASPIIAVGGAFIDRTPSWLKNFAVEKFGENDKNMLLLGLYVTIALIAILIGVIAWRRIWAGIVGIGLFGLFGGFVAYTRPESLPTDVIPSLAGGVAGIVAIVCLVRWTRERADGTFEAAAESRLRTVRTGWSGGPGWVA